MRSKEIEYIQFGLLSPEEIRQHSVVEVVHPESIDNGLPKAGGLLDPLMGTSEFEIMCKTCIQNCYKCVGHFGHIELAKPIFHIGYLGKIKKILVHLFLLC